MTARNRLLDAMADFTWDMGSSFLIETPFGNFEWSNPEYGGDNTVKPYKGTLEEWIEKNAGYARDKGSHIVRNYTGSRVIIID